MRIIPAVLALAATLSACATVPRFDAAGDIHAFLVAVRDGDRAGFEAHVDRAALKGQLRSRLLAEQAGRHGEASLQALGAVLAGPLVGVAVDALVQPEVFRAEAIKHGYDPAQPLPNRIVIASALRLVEPGRVCVVARKGGPCTLVFRDEGGAWRLVGYEGDLKALRR